MRMGFKRVCGYSVEAAMMLLQAGAWLGLGRERDGSRLGREMG